MAAADATTSLRVASHVLTNDLRHPALLAQEAATIDLFSSGRLELGIGAGWLRADYEALGLPFERPSVRVARLAEAVRLIKRLWTEERVTHQGTHYQLRDLALHPKPMQTPYPPIFIGGGNRRILTLAASEASIVGLDIGGTADGALELATSSADAMDQKVQWVRETAGDRLAALELHTLVHHVIVTGHRRRAAREVAAQWKSMPEAMVRHRELSEEQVLGMPSALIGTLAQIVEELEGRRLRYGISYITVQPHCIDAFAPIVERLTGR
jgi:probable F420-dependent oxidoreductase